MSHGLFSRNGLYWTGSGRSCGYHHQVDPGSGLGVWAVAFGGLFLYFVSWYLSLGSGLTPVTVSLPS